jgi:branched-chain amino acid transport system substrate-binding protein
VSPVLGKSLFVAIAIAAVVVLAGKAVWAAPEPFTIPVILSLTGSATATGTEEAQALRLLADLVNSSGGVRGRQIVFDIHDDQSNAPVAVQLMSAIVAKNPPIVLGPTLSGACNAVFALVQARGPLTYCLSSGVYPPKDSFMFTQGVPTKETVRLQVKFYRDRGWKRLAVIFTTDASGQDFERNFDAALALPENRGVTVVARERFGVSDVSVSAQISVIKAAKPQAVIAWAVGTPLGTVLHAMLDNGLDIPTGSSGANLNYDTMKRFSTILPTDLYFINVPGIAPDAIPPGPLRTAAAAYYNTLKAAGLAADAGYLLSWDPAVVVIGMLKSVGLDATPVEYKQYLENLHGFYGASGVYDFRDGSQRGLDGRSDIVLRYDKDKGQFVAVARIGSSLQQR